ncbi:MAG: hypothetical protein CMJ46_15585 [Planctomyces sp.]|nr:hypothetical protein [Planctomyces sp.]
MSVLTSRILLLTIGALLLSLGTASLHAEQKRKPASEQPVEYENHTLLFFESRHPYFIRLQISIDAAPPSVMRQKLLETLFEQADADHSDQLEVEELKQFRGPERMQSRIQMELESSETALNREQFVKLLEPTLGIPLGLRMESGRVSDLPDLFSKLDHNGDNRLEPEEWSSALHLLEKYDFDDDETLNLIEVMPLLRPLNLSVDQSTRTPAGQRAGLFELIDPRNPREQLAQQLLAQYDGGHDKAEDGQLDANELGWSDADWIARYDNNGDEALNRTELLRLLADPPAQRVWRMRMPLQKRLTVRFWETDDEDEEWLYPRSSSSRDDIKVGGWEIGIRVQNPRPQFSDVLTYYQLQFLKLDGDQNGKLSMEEAGPLTLLAPFAALDKDQDNELTRDELSAYVEREAQLAQCQLFMTVDRKTQSLFRLLDADSDRRLEPRELLDPTAKLKSFDINGDGELTEPEMKTVYELSFELQPPSLFDDTFSGNVGDRIGPILSPPTAGPEWFRQMDRNLDGDLTRREFLGPTDTFQQYDRDGDGLISPTEAETTLSSESGTPEEKSNE